MYPNSRYSGPKVPIWGLLKAKYMLFGYMDPLTLNPKTLWYPYIKRTLKWTGFELEGFKLLVFLRGGFVSCSGVSGCSLWGLGFRV